MPKQIRVDNLGTFSMLLDTDMAVASGFASKGETILFNDSGEQTEFGHLTEEEFDALVTAAENGKEIT